MNNKNIDKNQGIFQQDQEIDLKMLALIFWNKKLLILSFTSLFTILSIIYSLILPNIYTSTSLLIPTKSDDSLSSKLGAYSSLASFSGIDISNGISSRSDEAIERIKSFEFFSKYLLPNINLEDLIAVKTWDAKNNQLTHDKNLFDSSKQKWVRKASFPKKVIPSEQEAFNLFIDKFLSIHLNNDNSFVSVSIHHKSPILAKKWVEVIVFNINESMRQEDITLSQSYIDFLSESQKSVNTQFLKESISRLLEDQMQTLMLASANDAYVFKIIDSPIEAEIKSSPNRILIAILGTIVGLIMSMLIACIGWFRSSHSI